MKRLNDIRAKRQWIKEVAERKQSEYLVVKDYVDLQNKMRQYVETKAIGKKEILVLMSIEEVKKR